MTPRNLTRGDRTRLIVFAVRHTAGVALLIWLTVEAYRNLPRPQAFLLTAITVAFALFAATTWLRLLKTYRGQIPPRRVRR